MRKHIDLVESLSTKSDLEARFGTEDNYPIVYDEDQEVSLMGDFGYWSICTSWAHVVKSELPGRTKIYGFYTKDNDAPGMAGICDGHDFAVVDEQYIVDGWLKNVEEVTSRAVFDLEDPDDQEIIKKYYGDPKKWSLVG